MEDGIVANFQNGRLMTHLTVGLKLVDAAPRTFRIPTLRKQTGNYEVAFDPNNPTTVVSHDLIVRPNEDLAGLAFWNDHHEIMLTVDLVVLGDSSWCLKYGSRYSNLGELEIPTGRPDTFLYRLGKFSFSLPAIIGPKEGMDGEILFGRDFLEAVHVELAHGSFCRNAGTAAKVANALKNAANSGHIIGCRVNSGTNGIWHSFRKPVKPGIDFPSSCAKTPKSGKL